jgi:murein DD-endopeptidase MepM/ murein hydrolase activator NlpD
MRHPWRITALIIASAAVFGCMAVAFAEDAPADEETEDVPVSAEINSLQEQVNEKQASIDQIQRKISDYKKRINEAEARSLSLANELDLLTNRITKAQLDIEENNAEIDSVNAQIQILDARIKIFNDRLETDRALLQQILQKLQTYDNDFGLQVLFGTDSFSELFDRLQALESVNSDLGDTLKRAEEEKRSVELAKTEQEGKKQHLMALQETLKERQGQLEEEIGAKDTLLAQSQQSEAQYQVLVSDLKQESAYIDHQIAVLQGEIEDKLVDSDEIGDSSLLSWPADPSYRGLSVSFHDPTYPFRHLFEHSGIDIPEPMGTQITSAAPGYVAWTKTGQLYGNYVMIIHTNGIATLYAHLSKISVQQDQFVARGDVIGLSGGLPGTQGAGLSTGPHLHFEVRKDGIPVDPMGYLMAY